MPAILRSRERWFQQEETARRKGLESRMSLGVLGTERKSMWLECREHRTVLEDEDREEGRG